jgi:hypothetical protein
MTRRRSPKPDDLAFAGDCESCGASEVACENVRWLSPRRCCSACSHGQETDDG